MGRVTSRYLSEELYKWVIPPLPVAHVVIVTLTMICCPANFVLIAAMAGLYATPILEIGPSAVLAQEREIL